MRACVGAKIVIDLVVVVARFIADITFRKVFAHDAVATLSSDAGVESGIGFAGVTIVTVFTVGNFTIATERTINIAVFFYQLGA